MTTIPVSSTDTTSEIRTRWVPIARSTGVLALSLALTAGVLTAMASLVDTWSR